jgi:hypothetical protein
VSPSVDVEAALDPEAVPPVVEYLYERGWSDGMPLLPATEESVATFLAQTARDPDEVVAGLPQLDVTASVREVATHAVMAGCRPEYLPVVLAAWDALSAERAARGGGWQSTSGPAPLIVINGPIRHTLGVNFAGGVFGPGFRANSTIPRAIGLTVRNSFGVRPHEFGQATQGIPGRWSTCIAEDEEASPWEPLSVEAGATLGEDAVSATLIRTCEFVDNRRFQNHLEVLRDFADTMQRTGSWLFRYASVGIVMNPEHARLFHKAGMSKQDVREWLVEHSGRTESQLSAVGKGFSELPDGPFEPDHFHPVFADASPSSLPIIVAGSRNAAISMVFRVFGTWSGRSFPIR